MSLISVDAESDGPYPPDYSLVCFGAVVVQPGLTKTFYGKTKPISAKYIPEALAVSGFTRAEHEAFDDPFEVMNRFNDWLTVNSDGRPVFISDNPAYDFPWFNYYMYRAVNKNPFGFSARRIGDLYCGMMKDMGLNSEWKRKLRKTSHTHNPVDDAMGNAEAVLAMQKMGLRIKL